MNSRTQLSEVNQQFVAAMQKLFSMDVKPEQTDYGSLVFRGPGDPRGTRGPAHVVVALDPDVTATLTAATPDAKSEMMARLIANLEAQVRQRYNPDNIPRVALKVCGTIDILGE